VGSQASAHDPMQASGVMYVDLSYRSEGRVRRASLVWQPGATLPELMLALDCPESMPAEWDVAVEPDAGMVDGVAEVSVSEAMRLTSERVLDTPAGLRFGLSLTTHPGYNESFWAVHACDTSWRMRLLSEGEEDTWLRLVGWLSIHAQVMAMDIHPAEFLALRQEMPLRHSTEHPHTSASDPES
jgi:hypothetical protein